MGLEMSHTLDSIHDGTKEIAETAHVKTREFHENYVSKVLPDCGKYGDAAKFVAEMAPGVAEYNAIREGNWQEFAISAGIDVASIAAGALSMGTGYGAVKGGSVAARAGVKMAAKEVAEAGAKKAVKEVAEAGAKKAVKEVAEAGAKKAAQEVAEAGAKKAAQEVVEAGTKKAVQEIAETGAKKAAQEVVEAGAEKAAKEVAEAGAEKAAKEIAEAGAEKAAKELAEEGLEKGAKEIAEEGTEKAVKELAEEGTEKAAKEVDEVSQVVKNKLDGIAREEEVYKKLLSNYDEKNILREQYLRDKAGQIIKVDGSGRRIDFIVKQGDRIIRSIEVTSETALKNAQVAKELRILEEAKKIGGAFILDKRTGELLEFPLSLGTEIMRLK